MFEEHLVKMCDHRHQAWHRTARDLAMGRQVSATRCACGKELGEQQGVHSSAT
jgi:hypothetical protein